MGRERGRERGCGCAAATPLKVIRNESDECRDRASFTATATAAAPPDKATVLTTDNRQLTTDS